MLIHIPRWTPAVVFAALTFAHALVLPAFEGMDEPAHLSSVLQFAAGQGRPMPGRARLHHAVERAVALVPGPYHQWDDARTKLSGIGYPEWRHLPADERTRRELDLAELRIDEWREGELENWQAQHPPLFYAIVGTVVRATGATHLVPAHRVARLTSAAMYATTGIVLTAFIAGLWGASPLAVLFVTLFPMWYVMGARIANDALAIPALALALLLAIDQMRRPPTAWRLTAWTLAGAAAALGIAAKGYGLAFLPVAGVAAIIALVEAARGKAPWFKAMLPLAALAIAIVFNFWWVAENYARGAGISGLNENVTLGARGIVTVWDRLPYAVDLVFAQPRQVASATARAVAQALYVSNWTFGAAPWWFYVIQITAIGLVVGARQQRVDRLRTAARVVAGIALAAMAVGMAKSVLDYFILFGETRLAQGWYVWGVGASFSAVMALAFEASPPWRQRLALLLQLTCLTTSLATDAMFWSGLYERDPVFRTPVRVASLAGDRGDYETCNQL